MKIPKNYVKDCGARPFCSPLCTRALPGRVARGRNGLAGVSRRVGRTLIACQDGGDKPSRPRRRRLNDSTIELSNVFVGPSVKRLIADRRRVPSATVCSSFTRDAMAMLRYQVNSALHPFGVAKSSANVGWLAGWRRGGDVAVSLLPQKSRIVVSARSTGGTTRCRNNFPSRQTVTAL